VVYLKGAFWAHYYLAYTRTIFPQYHRNAALRVRFIDDTKLITSFQLKDNLDAITDLKDDGAPTTSCYSIPQGGGYSQKIWVGVCSPLPKTLTLFMTKICDFPYLIYDLTKNFIPYLHV